jgi:hypothetical protein
MKMHFAAGMEAINIIEEQRALLDKFRTRLKLVDSIVDNVHWTVNRRIEEIRKVLDGKLDD